MAIYFKFKSAKDPDFVSLDEHFISVANLKEKIVDKKKLRKGKDHDLVLSNAQTNEEYIDEDYLVPRHTSVLVRRVPRPSVTIVVKEKLPHEVAPVNSGLKRSEAPQAKILRSPAVDELDDFGIDLYAAAEVTPAPVRTLSDADEDDRIRALVKNSALEWQREAQESGAGARGYINNGRGRDHSLRGEQGRGLEKKIPPLGYICHRCRVAGHFIKHCPTNGDPEYDVKRVRPPTGIPKTMLVPDSDGTYFLPTGEVGVLKPDEVVFEREVECLPSSGHNTVAFPPELCCPICKDVLKNAVLTSRCCFQSYCVTCIRNVITSKGKCASGAKNILGDDLLPNRTLRDAIDKLLESQVSSFTSSGNASNIRNSGNVGSRVQVPYTQSAHKRQRLTSRTVSTALKEASPASPESGVSDTNEALSRERDIVKNQLQSERRTKLVIKLGPSDHVEQGLEVGDNSAESQLKEPRQEAVSSERLVALGAEVKDQGHTKFEQVKASKKRKVKRVHSESTWSQEPDYNNFPDEDCCIHCGSYDHLSWDCYMLGYPGQFHEQIFVQGPMFRPGFNPQMHPQMAGMMHPQCEGYRMSYNRNSGTNLSSSGWNDVVRTTSAHAIGSSSSCSHE